jgi:hypothetical protein
METQAPGQKEATTRVELFCFRLVVATSLSTLNADRRKNISGKRNEPLKKIAKLSALLAN